MSLYFPDDQQQIIHIGIWSILGLFVFLFIERIFEQGDENNTYNAIKIIGYLNAVANVADNFTHGIAVAGSYQSSIKVNFFILKY